MSVDFLGRYLVQKGVINESQLIEATDLHEHGNHKLGELAVQKGLLTEEQAAAVIEAQRRLDAPFGELAVRLGFLARRQLNALLFAQKVGCRHLGECLLKLGYVSREDFSSLLQRYQVEERAREINIEYMLSGGQENILLCLAWEAVEKAFARFAGVLLKIETVGAAHEVRDFDFGFCVEIKLAGRGTAHLGLAADAALSASISGLPGQADQDGHDGRQGQDKNMALEDVCAIAGHYFAAGLTKYGLAPVLTKAAATPPDTAAQSARGGGALNLAAMRGRMGLWLNCLEEDGGSCLLAREGG